MRRRIVAAAVLLASCEFSPVLPRGEPPPPGSFTIAVLPDTQGYVTNYRWDRALSSQTRWIAENAAEHNIRYVVQLGDVTWYNRTTEWEIARGLFEPLHDGDDVRVPYAIAPGNHDLGPNGMAENRWSLMDQDQFFGRNSPYGRQPTIGGFYDPTSTKNTWHEFEANGAKWMILAVEFGMSDEVVAWADEVVRTHPDHRVIVILHAYLEASNARFQYIPYAGNQTGNPHDYPLDRTEESVNDGEELWAKLISKHRNVHMVLCGHALGDGEGRMTSVGDHGQIVHQLLQNYQTFVDDSEFGGEGYFRLFEFWPDDETVHVRTFSPWIGEYIDAPGHDYYLALGREPVAVDAKAAIEADAPLLFYRPHLAAGAALTNHAAGRPDLSATYEGDEASAAAFDGDDVIRVDAPLPRLPEWTIEAWVRPELRGSGQIVFANDRAPTQEVAEDADPEAPATFTYHDDVILGVAPEGSTFSAATFWAVTHRDQSGARTVAECQLPVLAGRWYHVAASGDGEYLRLFINGDLVEESEAAGPDLDLADAEALFGRSENLPGAAFHGELAELAIYDRALRSSELLAHYTAGFSRVTAATIDITGPVLPDAEELEGVDLGPQGYPGLAVTIANRGDFQVFRGSASRVHPAHDYTAGTPALTGEGVLLATIAEAERSGIVASAELNWNSWNDGIIAVSMTQVGAIQDNEPPPPPEDDSDSGGDAPEDEGPSLRELIDVERTVLNEVNVDTNLAWFPFQGGWRGGHVRSDGALFRSNGVAADAVRGHPDAGPEDGRVLIDLGVDPGADGLLFAIGASGRNRVVVAGASAEHPGWEVRVQANSVLRDDVEPLTLAEALVELDVPEEAWEEYEEAKLRTWDSFAFVFVPIDALGLVGGVYDGIERASQLAVGDFAITPLGEPGAYHLEIPGESVDTGVLVLTGADVLDPTNVTLTMEGDELGGFTIRAWEVETAAPRDTVFSWAFIRFSDPIEAAP